MARARGCPINPALAAAGVWTRRGTRKEAKASSSCRSVLGCSAKGKCSARLESSSPALAMCAPAAAAAATAALAAAEPGAGGRPPGDAAAPPSLAEAPSQRSAAQQSTQTFSARGCAASRPIIVK